MGEPLRIRAEKITASVFTNMVTITLVCDDDYKAQVLFDDLSDRLKAGEKIALQVPAARQPGGSDD